MAPSRKKSKASLVAAARRQWKVGDLVLAKVKGFPAWPATVSEPEKWGYSADWKKVLVYFFGTNQIAFCNPADVEAFTEEKKESLLVKRQGKGADFVRAVHEIIESYEKLKKQDQLDDINSVDEVIVPNAGNSVDSLASSRLRDQTEASSGTFISQSNSNYAGDRNEPSLPVGDAVNTALHDRGTFCEERKDDVVSIQKPLAITYTSRKRLIGKQPHDQVTQRRALRSRTSRSQNLVVSISDGTKSAGDILSSVMQDGSLRRNKRSKKSPDSSEWHCAGSPAFVSNGSIEDNGSEIVTADSDTLSLNEGSTLESGSNLERAESECLEGDVELSKRLDLQIKAVVIKKKRKPNRKRVSNDAPELTAVLDKAAGVELEVHKCGQNPPNLDEQLDGRFSKEDGDEHLPLVKRARVRMGKQLAGEEKLDSFIKLEENSFKSVPTNGPVCRPSSCDDDSPDDVKSVLVKENVVSASPANICFKSPENRLQVLEVKKNQPFGSLDDEAALPPSKRLHRALEAMSANVAEGAMASAEAPVPNGCRVSPIKEYHDMSVESKVENDLGVQSTDAFGGNDAEGWKSQLSASINPLILEETGRSRSEVDNWNQPVRLSWSTKEEVESAEAVVAPDAEGLLLDLDGRHASPGTNLDPLHHLSLKDGRKCEHLGSSHDRAESPDKRADMSESSGISKGPVAEPNKITKGSPQNGTTGCLCREEDNCCEITKSLKIHLEDNSQNDGVCEFSHKSPQIAEKVSIDASHGMQSSPHSASISVGSLDEKDVSGIQSSSSPADGVSISVRVSQSSTSLCHMTKTDCNSFPKSNGSCSPEVQLSDKKVICNLDLGEGKLDSALTSMGKWSNHAEARAALTSFEAMLGTLTRTKECIGRATRIAIDCGKLGTAVKVVNILARNLENESSLHKRVDLFFLVDSIMQCSRSLKGDVGSIYPSAIQAALPRILLATAPPGNTAQENRRQCLKVLRLWLERRVLPEATVRHHIRHLDSLSGSSSAGAFSRRPLRNERALDDPIREMEGMLVDEYGSNSSFQLPGFCMPRMLKDEDEGSDSDGGSFEAVTPEHNSETPKEQQPTSQVEKHSHILEDVDGELEMEDVAPSCDIEMSSMSNINEVNSAHTSHHEQPLPLSFAPPLPNDVHPPSPPLPTSPPPPPPPPPPPLPSPSEVPDPYANGVDSKLYVGINNMQDNLKQSEIQPAVPLIIKPAIPDTLHCPPPECQDFQMEMRRPDSTNTCSFGNFPVPHPPLQSMNNVPQADDAVFHNKAYHLQPPHPAPSNQFSYVQTDQRVQSWRDTPFPQNSNGYHFPPTPPNVDGGNFYPDCDRGNSIPHDFNESWRFSRPPLSGPFYPPDRARAPFAPVPFVPSEPYRVRDQGWAFPPQEMNYRNSMPMRPFCEAPRFWRPR